MRLQEFRALGSVWFESGASRGRGWVAGLVGWTGLSGEKM